MSCNPAIGGLAKGHIVREIDALGGQMGLTTDYSCIQFKRLNATRGPAVRGSRAQCDKDVYSAKMTEVLSSHPNVQIIESEVKSLVLAGSICQGVVLDSGVKVMAKAVILTTGTFMNGLMHLGSETQSGGRVGDKATVGLSDQLRAFGFDVRRLKTGTPARLDRDSIDFSKTKPESGDERFFPFSFRGDRHLRLTQVDCYLAYTNEKTHEIINKNLHRSPIYGGIIESSGPRYCPSIEDKVVRFSERQRHQTFLEPEGLNTNSIYLQGISTSLPSDVQDQFLKTIPGLENVRVLKYGYAIEYDFFEPTQINKTLETRGIENLYFAGQINGTSGYEEAAGQGLIAGANASLKIQGRNPLILGRDEAYIGVLIDDLVTKGTKEPYRMFTSRAEFRLNLREDNTLERLVEVARRSSLLNDKDYEAASKLLVSRKSELERLRKQVITPKPEVQMALEKLNTPVLQKPISLATLMRRNEVSYLDLSTLGYECAEQQDVYEPVEIAIKYEGYIGRQADLLESAKKLEGMLIPDSFDYSLVKGLSKEEVQKLSNVRPNTIGQASRISGVNPSGVQALMVFIKGQSLRKERSL
jgi:tRNA uridine 5-carboxymethylaminomethyl modification enzyme